MHSSLQTAAFRGSYYFFRLVLLAFLFLLFSGEDGDSGRLSILNAGGHDLVFFVSPHSGESSQRIKGGREGGVEGGKYVRRAEGGGGVRPVDGRVLNYQKRGGRGRRALVMLFRRSTKAALHYCCGSARATRQRGE